MSEDTNNAKPAAMALPLRVLLTIKGYYTIAVLVGLCFGACGAVAGYMSKKPTYRTEGTLRITPLTLKILYSSNIDVAPSIFDAFVDVQLALLQSRPVIERVVTSPEWQAVAPGEADEAITAFRRGLTVRHATRSELVDLTYMHESADAVGIALKLLIDSYMAVHGDQSSNQRMTAIEQANHTLAAELEAYRTQMLAIAREFGTEDLEPIYTLRMAEVSRLESLVQETLINLRIAESAVGDGDQASRLSVAEITMNDELLRDYTKELAAARNELDSKRRRLGPAHGSIAPAELRVAQLEAMVARRADEYRQFARSATVTSDRMLQGVATMAVVKTLRDRYAELTKLLDDARSRALDVGQKNIELHRLAQEAERVRIRLDENNRKYEQLRVDSSVIGSINVISAGTRPNAPYKDQRKMMAAAGLAGGFASGAAAVAALALVLRRIRTATDLRLLGAAPAGVFDLTGSAAVQQIDRMRAMIEMNAHTQGCRVVAVTGLTAGCPAFFTARQLALSFAESGSRTLFASLDSASLNEGGPDLSPGTDRSATLRFADFQIADVLPSDQVNLSTTTALAGHRLSSGVLRRFADAACKAYDMVVIDAGEAAQSLDALAACAEADQAVIVVPRRINVLKARTLLSEFTQADVRIAAMALVPATHRMPPSASSDLLSRRPAA